MYFWTSTRATKQNFVTLRDGRQRSVCNAEIRSRQCLSWVCAVTRRRFPVGASPTRQPLQPEATGAAMEVTKWLKPSECASRIGDGASVQAVTRVNAEQASKRTMRRPTRRPFRGRLTRLGERAKQESQPLRRGSGDSMYTRKAHATREAPQRDQGWSTGGPRGTGRARRGDGEARSTAEAW